MANPYQSPDPEPTSPFAKPSWGRRLCVIGFGLLVLASLLSEAPRSIRQLVWVAELGEFGVLYVVGGALLCAGMMALFSGPRLPAAADCSFCKQSFRQVGPLVEGPKVVYICTCCAEEMKCALAAGGEPRIETSICSFCRRETIIIRPEEDNRVGICRPCADLTLDILDRENRRRAQNMASSVPLA